MTHLIGWAIFHSIWQAGVVALLTAAVLLLLRGASAATRYRVAIVALLVMAVAPVLTVRATRANIPTAEIATSRQRSDAAPLNGALVAERDGPGRSDITATRSNVSSSTDNNRTIRERAEPILPWVVACWLLGVLLMSGRTAAGLIWARRLARTGTKAVSDQLRGAAARIGDDLRVRVAVRVLESSRATVPMVIGWLRPVILIPAAMLTGLTPQQLEAILAHELAHVRRNDYLVNLLQTILETLYFYHPAAWWLSGRIREERENACDELAVAACGGDRIFYSRVLLTVEEARHEQPMLAVAASGGTLRRRIERLLGGRHVHLDIGPRWYAGVFTIALAMTTASSLARDEAFTPLQLAGLSSDTTRPRTVVRYTGNAPLDERWRWASEQAQTNRFRQYWVGYLIDGAAARFWVHYDRQVPVAFDGLTITGGVRMSEIGNVRMRGVALSDVIGAADAHDIMFLVEYRNGALSRVHAASYVFPMDFRGLPLVWLGRASEPESVQLLAALDRQLRSDELRTDVTAAVGMHTDGSAALPVLERWARDGKRSSEARTEAVEGMQHFDSPQLLGTLAQLARHDRDEDVRSEAIEAIGHSRAAGALDTLTSFARTLGNHRLQSQAIESIGNLTDARRSAVLRELIEDRSLAEELRQEALESLGNVADSKDVVAALGSYAAPGQDRTVQEGALDALVSAQADNQEKLSALLHIVDNHPDEYMQARAAEAIAELEPRERALSALQRIVQQHRSGEVRRRALEGLASLDDDERAAAIVLDVAQRHSDQETRRRAIDLFAPFAEQRAFDEIAGIALSNEPVELRRTAVQTYVENAAPQKAIDFARRLIHSNAPYDVRREAVEALSSVEDEGAVKLLIEIARDTNEPDLRRKALEALIDSDDPRAVEALRRIR